MAFARSTPTLPYIPGFCLRSKSCAREDAQAQGVDAIADVVGHFDADLQSQHALIGKHGCKLHWMRVNMDD